jgi:hypothetical protein
MIESGLAGELSPELSTILSNELFEDDDSTRQAIEMCISIDSPNELSAALPDDSTDDFIDR